MPPDFLSIIYFFYTMVIYLHAATLLADATVGDYNLSIATRAWATLANCTKLNKHTGCCHQWAKRMCYWCTTSGPPLDCYLSWYSIIDKKLFQQFYLQVFLLLSKAKVRVLCAVQQPGSYWHKSSAFPLVLLKFTEVTAYD